MSENESVPLSKNIQILLALFLTTLLILLIAIISYFRTSPVPVSSDSSSALAPSTTAYSEQKIISTIQE